MPDQFQAAITLSQIPKSGLIYRLTFTHKSYASRGIHFIYTYMHGNRNYKFKVINGVLSWRNSEMEKYTPVSAEILTRVILLYEKQLKNGIRIWKQIEENDIQGKTFNQEDPLLYELASWMEELQGIFADTEPWREKEKWTNHQIHLN